MVNCSTGRARHILPYYTRSVILVLRASSYHDYCSCIYILYFCCGLYIRRVFASVVCLYSLPSGVAAVDTIPSIDMQIRRNRRSCAWYTYMVNREATSFLTDRFSPSFIVTIFNSVSLPNASCCLRRGSGTYLTVESLLSRSIRHPHT